MAMTRKPRKTLQSLIDLYTLSYMHTRICLSQPSVRRYFSVTSIAFSISGREYLCVTIAERSIVLSAAIFVACSSIFGVE